LVGKPEENRQHGSPRRRWEIILIWILKKYEKIAVAVRSKAWVYGRSLAGIAGSNPTGGMDVCLL
jgi:hypothetical protein